MDLDGLLCYDSTVPPDYDRLREIQIAFHLGRYGISRHATARMLRRGIRTDEIEETVATAEVIEEYPDDKYGPSILLLGFTRGGRPRTRPLCAFPDAGNHRVRA